MTVIGHVNTILYRFSLRQVVDCPIPVPLRKVTVTFHMCSLHSLFFISFWFPGALVDVFIILQTPSEAPPLRLEASPLQVDVDPA